MEINGIKYEEIPQKKPRPMSKTLASIMAMSSAFEYMNPYASRTKRHTVQVDNLEKEFELIQLKQSKLSRNERDAVEAAFYRKYRIVK